jgi:hypothetical protein
VVIDTKLNLAKLRSRGESSEESKLHREIQRREVADRNRCWRGGSTKVS